MPGRSDRSKKRIIESGTDLNTILRCFLSFKTVVTSRNILVFKIFFSRPKNGLPSYRRARRPRGISCCRGRRQPKDPVGRHRGRRVSRRASLDSQGHWYSKPSARRTGQLLTRSRISSWRDLSGPEGEGNYPLRCHGAAPTSQP